MSINNFIFRNEKKQYFLNYSLLLMVVFLVCASSCKKDDDNNEKNLNVPVLSTSSVTDITQTSATSGGNITSDGGTTVTKRGVCWSKSQDPTIADSTTIDGSGPGSFTSNIIGLTANTPYYVRAYAANRNGTGYGSVMSFTTQEDYSPGIFTDPRDCTVYKTVTIGDQVWMAENLKYLPSVIQPDSGSQTTPYYYVYGYRGTDVAFAKTNTLCSIYGVLYNWSAAMNRALSSNANPSGVQGACPAGWHLPSDAEWTELIDYLGGKTIAGNKLKEAGNTHWYSHNTEATNITGFTALPGGLRSLTGSFANLGAYGEWWSATEYSTDNAMRKSMSYGAGIVGIGYADKAYGFSVRCLKD